MIWEKKCFFFEKKYNSCDTLSTLMSFLSFLVEEKVRSEKTYIFPQTWVCTPSRVLSFGHTVFYLDGSFWDDDGNVSNSFDTLQLKKKMLTRLKRKYMKTVSVDCRLLKIQVKHPLWGLEIRIIGFSLIVASDLLFGVFSMKTSSLLTSDQVSDRLPNRIHP